MIPILLLTVLPGVGAAGPLLSGERDEPAGWDEPGIETIEELGAGRRAAARELLVRLVPGASLEDAVAALEALGPTAIGAVPRLGVLRLRLPAGADPDALATRLRARPDVRLVGRNGIGTVAGLAPPDDPHFDEQWQFENAGSILYEPDADIDLLDAWCLTRGSAGVTVALLDTGLDVAHPELAGRTLPGWDFVDEDADPDDPNGHGTHVAGLIGANSNDGFGVAGVDPACRLLPVRVADANGNFTEFDLVQGLDWAAVSGARVANLSLQTVYDSPLLESALLDAAAQGLILVAASSNLGPGGADASVVSASPATIAIGMTRSNDTLGFNSGTGEAVDFVAPGYGVVTLSIATPGESSIFVGTSGATGIATGIVSLLLSLDPGLDRDAVYELLRAGAEDQVGAPFQDPAGWDPQHGFGRLNAAASLRALCHCTSLPPLLAHPARLPALDGGRVGFRLDAGPAHAAESYWLLGSASGTAPGLALDGGLLPLNDDAYFRVTLKQAGGAFFPGTTGLLDADGVAHAGFLLPALGDPTLIGLTLHHAFLVFSPFPTVGFVSAAVPLELDAPPGAVPLLTEDFENGAAGWTLLNGFTGQWHLAPAGECGALSARMSYDTGAGACHYAGPLGSSSGTLASPGFPLSGGAPWTLELLTLRDIDSGGGDVTLVRLVDDGDDLADVLIDLETLAVPPGVSTELSLPLALSPKWSGRTVHLEFELCSDAVGNLRTGWSVDDVALFGTDG